MSKVYEPARERLLLQIVTLPRCVMPLLLLVALASSLMLPVNPWERDAWFHSHTLLFASVPGADNYTPIAVPALYYKAVHLLAAAFGQGLREEFYLASLGQGLMLGIAACFVFHALRALGYRAHAGWAALLLLLFVLSTGLPQAMWSESTVLLMFAAALYLSVRIYADGAADPRFWRRSTWCGVLVGLLVITRVTPVLMIPAMTLLLLRFPRRRLVGHTAIVSGATVLLVLAAMTANQYRFGRFELTNSAGRHLWQGVTTFVSAAAQSPAYQSLKALNPDLEGLDWWVVRLPYASPDNGEALFGRVAKEAIRAEPLTFVAVGAEKFARTIYRMPYRLGFGLKNGNPDPLDVDEPLRAIAAWPGGAFARFTNIAERSMALLYSLFAALYPSVVLVALAPLPLRILRRLGNLPAWLRGSAWGAYLAFGLYSILLCRDLELARFKVPMIILLAVILALQLVPALEPLRLTQDPSSERRADPLLLGFLALMFFVSLAGSWLVEVANTRNTLPYLPFLTLLAVIGATEVRAAWRLSPVNAFAAGVPEQPAQSIGIHASIRDKAVREGNRLNCDTPDPATDGLIARSERLHGGFIQPRASSKTHNDCR